MMCIAVIQLARILHRIRQRQRQTVDVRVSVVGVG